MRRQRGSQELGERLQATLANAVRAPYYRRAFGSAWRKVRRVEDLARLPLLDKLTAIRHQRELVVGRAPPGFGVASSGTTRAEVDLPLLGVWRDEDGPGEVDEEPPASTPDPWPGWVLVSVAVHHGLPGAPGPDELQLPWMHDRNALQMMEQVLSRPQPDGRRVTTLRISAGALKVFTAWLLERGKDPSKFGVRAIGTNSFRLSPFWRRTISERFGAELFDNYSLSELRSCATECGFCGWHHWGWPPMAREVVDLATGAPLQRGVGRLVATTLFPFVRKMPLVRYDTGDVVELGPRCRGTGQRGYRFLGRQRRGLVVPSRGAAASFLLAPTLVQDVLEDYPETERNEHPCVKLGIIRTREVGLPRWTVALEGSRRRPTAHLRFEVRFSPLLHPERARQLESDVGGNVLFLDGALRRRVRSGAIDFEATAVPSGSLTPPPDKHD